jgi:hypothetical protein
MVLRREDEFLYVRTIDELIFYRCSGPSVIFSVDEDDRFGGILRGCHRAVV